jgi:hypothetical protein
MRTSVSSDRSAAGVSVVYMRHRFRSVGHVPFLFTITIPPCGRPAWLRVYGDMPTYASCDIDTMRNDSVTSSRLESRLSTAPPSRLRDPHPGHPTHSTRSPTCPDPSLRPHPSSRQTAHRD